MDPAIAFQLIHLPCGAWWIAHASADYSRSLARRSAGRLV